jgi:hypothetical protein
MRALELPTNDCLVKAARCIEAAMATEEVGPVRKACMGFLALAAEFYGVTVPQVLYCGRVRSVSGREIGVSSSSGITALTRSSSGSGCVLPFNSESATFTSDLLRSVAARHPRANCFAVPVNHFEGCYQYPDVVRFEIEEQDLNSYRQAADFLKHQQRGHRFGPA